MHAPLPLVATYEWQSNCGAVQAVRRVAETQTVSVLCCAVLCCVYVLRSVIISSGDTGARNPAQEVVFAYENADICADNAFMPSYPASSPYVTAVGATQFLMTEGETGGWLF